MGIVTNIKPKAVLNDWLPCDSKFSLFGTFEYKGETCEFMSQGCAIYNDTMHELSKKYSTKYQDIGILVRFLSPTTYERYGYFLVSFYRDGRVRHIAMNFTDEDCLDYLNYLN